MREGHGQGAKRISPVNHPPSTSRGVPHESVIDSAARNGLAALQAPTGQQDIRPPASQAEEVPPWHCPAGMPVPVPRRPRTAAPAPTTRVASHPLYITTGPQPSSGQATHLEQSVRRRQHVNSCPSCGQDLRRLLHFAPAVDHRQSPISTLSQALPRTVDSGTFAERRLVRTTPAAMQVDNIRCVDRTVHEFRQPALSLSDPDIRRRPEAVQYEYMSFDGTRSPQPLLGNSPSEVSRPVARMQPTFSNSHYTDVPDTVFWSR